MILDRPQQRRKGPGALTHLEENQIGLKGKSGISEMSKPSFPFVMIENVK